MPQTEKLSELNDAGISESAARWSARLHAPDCSPADREAFESWCLENPAHVAAWLEMCELHTRARQSGEGNSGKPLMRASTHAGAHATARRRRRLGLTLAAAASVILAIGVFGYRALLSPGDAVTYATAVGQQRQIALDDGSALVLDTDSLVHVRMNDRIRELTVERGRLGVTIAEDRRPFEVLAGRGRVRDVGTKFQVAKYGTSVAVVLIEGLIDIDLDRRSTPTRLLPGQQVAFGEEGGLGDIVAADLDVEQAWTEGRIVLRERRLDDLLAEVNRYSTTPIRLADPSIGKQTVSGVFDVRDQKGLLDALAAGWGLVAMPKPDGEIVLQRR